MEILPITAIFAAFIGFVFGWLSGHFRHNSVLRDMENALLAIEKENSALKDYEKFYRHHLAAAFGSTSPVLSDDQIGREAARQNVYGYGNNLNILGAQGYQSAKEYNSRLDDIKKQNGAV